MLLQILIEKLQSPETLQSWVLKDHKFRQFLPGVTLPLLNMLEPESRDRPGSTMRQQIILLPSWRRCLPFRSCRIVAASDCGSRRQRQPQWLAAARDRVCIKVRVPRARWRREDYCCLLLSRAELIFSYTERERSGRALILLRYSSALLMRVMSRR